VLQRIGPNILQLRSAVAPSTHEGVNNNEGVRELAAMMDRDRLGRTSGLYPILMLRVVKAVDGGSKALEPILHRLVASSTSRRLQGVPH